MPCLQDDVSTKAASERLISVILRDFIKMPLRNAAESRL